MEQLRNHKGQFIKQEWTEGQLRILKEMYPNTHSSEVAELVGRTRRSVLNKAAQLGLRKSKEYQRLAGMRLKETGRASRFNKGITPHNKGKKQTEYLSAEAIELAKTTWFKKGHTPGNSVPIGYERVCRKEGYIYLKVPESRKLVLKHRYVWEQNMGKIPAGYNVQFKDGNRKNCDINNLYLASRQENMAANAIHNYPEEVRMAIRRISKVNKIIKEQSNETDKH